MADKKYRVRIGVKGTAMGAIPFKLTIAFDIQQGLLETFTAVKPFIDGVKAENSTWLVRGQGFCEIVPKEKA